MTTQTTTERQKDLNHHTADVLDAFESGWIWEPDNLHPAKTTMHAFAWFMGDSGWGWYTKASHKHFARRAGDSRPRWVAAQALRRMGELN